MFLLWTYELRADNEKQPRSRPMGNKHRRSPNHGFGLLFSFTVHWKISKLQSWVIIGYSSSTKGQHLFVQECLHIPGESQVAQLEEFIKITQIHMVPA